MVERGPHGDRTQMRGWGILDQYYAEAVLREFQAANEHALDLWRPGWRDEEERADG
jgi:hypothetical protein